VSWGYRFERWFHNAGVGVMAASSSLRKELEANGLRNVQLWSRGVEVELFRPREINRFGAARPIFLYVGRVAIEKNIEVFLELDLPGTKAVIGGGPLLEKLRRRHHSVVFTGPKFGDDLAQYYASADVFVFPSLTDTFGNVMLEALASGLPVAAFPVTGPKDVLVEGVTGSLNADLREAALSALALDRAACRASAERMSWAACARRFLEIVEASAGRARGLSPAA
jgi:glycosyltransferase involved in cell wall biosynthesis